MRKLLSTLSVLLFFVIVTRAQAPAFINYQGVARNAVGNAMVNHTIRLKLTIRDGGALGPSVYSETRQLTTNAFGLFNVQIGGAGATNVTGSIGSASWYNGTKWLQVEIDPQGGTTFKDIGTTQLISVPYSLYTNQSGDIVLPFSKSQGEDVPLFKLVNTNNNASSLAYEGLSSSTANNATAIRGILTSVNPGAFSAAVTGQNNGTGANGIGVYGNQNGSGWGVYGTTPGGIGVYGNSVSGTGVYGQSFSGASVYGFKDINGQGNVGLFRNTSTINASPVVSVETNGSGNGISVNATGMGKGAIIAINNAGNTTSGLEVFTNGTGRVGLFQNTNSSNASTALEVLTNGTGKVGVLQNTNAANASNVLDVSTNGTGKVGVFQNTNAANASNVVDATTNGTGRAGLFQNTNAANAASNVSLLTNGTGDNLQSVMTGTGKASSFTINNAANGSFAIDATSNGTNNVINSISTGTGRAGFFQVNNAASTADALSAVSNGTGASWAFRATNSGANGAGLFIQSNAANTANNLQSNQAGLGRAGLFNATNAANTANALEVNMAGTGFAASFSSTNGTPKALRTAGAVQLTGIGEGVNRLLMTDASGNANWNTVASIGGVSGTGTLNYVSKWTPNGTFVGNSQIFDDGTNVGINSNIPSSKLFVNGDFISKTNTTGYVGIFENTNLGNGDGIKIRLGKAKSIYSPPSLGDVLSPAQAARLRNMISCDYSASQKFDMLQDVIAESLTEDLQTIAGIAVGTGNIIIQQINNLLSLPLKIGPYSTPTIHIWDATTIFGGLTMPPGIPNIPSIGIPALDIPSVQVLPQVTVMPELPTIDLSGIGIPAIDITSLSFWGIPDLCFSDAPGSSPMNNSNEFIRFADKDDAKMGSIRAVSVTDWATNFLDPVYMYRLYSAFTSSKVDKYHAKYHFKTEIAKAVLDYSKLGVEYTSGNGDYAEWLERTDAKELISAGDIVAVKAGKITKDLDHAEQVMVVSHNPIVLGNIPKEGMNYMGNNIAFMGQVPVKVMGPVASGDYIVGQIKTPGYGIAKHPNEMTIEDFKYAVGRSWVSDDKEGPKMVNTVVGVHNGDYLRILKNFEAKFSESESRLKTLESKVDALIQKKGF